MTAIDTKDRLWQMLNVDSNDEQLANVERVLDTLELTTGMWVELRYAYKGRELAQRCIDVLNIQLGFCQHWKRIQRLEGIKQHALEVLREYSEAEAECWQ
jgi:hypothetical protein